MTTKTITTPTGKTITVEIVRKVQDKVAYMDGYNLVSGREIVDYTNIVLRDATGKILTTGNCIHNLTQKYDSKAIAAGAVGQVGSAYLRQDMYDLVAGLLAEVEAETPKSDEQIAIETAKAKAEETYSTWYESDEQIAARKFQCEMESEDSDY
jgi:hypothetical protein